MLAADTVVVRDDDVLGKPIDRDDAIQTLRSLAGRHHRVLTGWTVRSTTEERFGVAEQHQAGAVHLEVIAHGLGESGAQGRPVARGPADLDTFDLRAPRLQPVQMAR